jgi:hypothetical protein
MSTRPLRVVQATLPLILLGVLSLVCLACTWHRPCKVPDRLDVQDVYVANGNMLSGGNRTFQWDKE